MRKIGNRKRRNQCEEKFFFKIEGSSCTLKREVRTGVRGTIEDVEDKGP